MKQTLIMRQKLSINLR